MTVAENVAFGLRMEGLPAAEVRRRTDEYLDLVGLSGLSGRLPAALSGGQQQRVALARALSKRPAVLLLDEPLGALDLKLRQAMQVELKRIQREVGITFVYVTHDQNEALTMSDRIAVMSDGSIEHLGTPREIYEHPRTRFVAGFIGVSNLMPGQVVSRLNGRGELRLDSGAQVSADGLTGLAVGDRCYAVVRPEKLRIERVEDPVDAGRPSVEGIVESSIYLGTATQFLVRLPDGVTMTVLVPNADEAERQRLPGAGVHVRLSWSSEHTHVVRETAAPVQGGVESDDKREALTLERVE